LTDSKKLVFSNRNIEGTSHFFPFYKSKAKNKIEKAKDDAEPEKAEQEAEIEAEKKKREAEIEKEKKKMKPGSKQK